MEHSYTAIVPDYAKMAQTVSLTRNSPSVSRVYGWSDFTPGIFEMLVEGLIWSMYLDNGEVVAEDIFGRLHRNILD